MNKEQITLLYDVLGNSLHDYAWVKPSIDFPTTICDIISAHITYYQNEIDLVLEDKEKHLSDSYFDRVVTNNQKKIARLQELKTIMAGK